MKPVYAKESQSLIRRKQRGKEKGRGTKEKKFPPDIASLEKKGEEKKDAIHAGHGGKSKKKCLKRRTSSEGGTLWFFKNSCHSQRYARKG